MKKLLMFAAVFTFLFLTAFSTKIQAQEYKWGDWSQDPCYRGLQFRARYSEYNEFAKKHHWYIQYKNNYSQRFAFSYGLAGSRDELAAHVKEYGSSYRTEIKPGEIDSGMWVLTSSPSQIFEVAGHGRLLNDDELDVEGTFMRCDAGGNGNLGQVDYICSNEPKSHYSCSNHVHPPPAAFVYWNKMTGAGVTSAARQPTPQDCLDLYKYFSDNRKSDDPIAIKQALDAAQVFQRQCKTTDEQKAGVGEAITSSQNHLQQIQSETSQNKPPTNELLNGTEAVKKGDVSGLKQKIVENLKQNVRPYQKTERKQTRITFRGTLGDLDDYVNYINGAKDITISSDQNNITINWVIYFSSTYDKWSEGNSSYTEKNVATITFENLVPTEKYENLMPDDRFFSIDRLGARCILQRNEISRNPPSNFTLETCGSFPYSYDNNENYTGAEASKELVSLISQLQKALSGQSSQKNAESQTGNNAGENANLPKIEPTTIEQYQKKVVAEAKAKGITLPPNFLTASPSENKKPPARLTPAQRTAQNAQLTADLASLIQKDSDMLPSEKEDQDAEAVRKQSQKTNLSGSGNLQNSNGNNQITQSTDNKGKLSSNDLKKRIIENLKANIKTYSNTYPGGVISSTKDVVIAANEDRITVKIVREKTQNSSSLYSTTVEFSFLFTALTTAYFQPDAELSKIHIDNNVSAIFSETTVKLGRTETKNSTGNFFTAVYFGGEAGVKELVELATKLKNQSR